MYRLKHIFASLLAFSLLAIVTSCNKGEFKPNQPPDTRISIEEINLAGDQRLNSTVRLNWYGTDRDGYVDRFETSMDNQNWSETFRQDSLFVFSIPAGQDTTDVDFYVRAIDNEGERDPSPAYLAIPLKNTPPEVSFDIDAGPNDTVLLVSTFNWDVTDQDGDLTVTKVEIRVNDGSWYELNLGQRLISFVLDRNATAGPATADLHYGSDRTPVQTGIDGFIAEGINTLYIKATDIAGGESAVDTSDSFYLRAKNPNADVLWVAGQAQVITDKYQNILDAINVQYDLVNYGKDISGGTDLPKYWDPTFSLLAANYPKMFINTGQETFTNTINGQIKTILEFMGPVMVEFTIKGGKSFITTSFKKEQELDDLTGAYPVDSLITPSGQARILPDSALLPVLSGNYPNLSPSNVQSGIVPISVTPDADEFYRAQLLKLQGWDGSDIIAAVRRPENEWRQVFFGLELHYYDKNFQELEDLFEEILINEF
jgi:hypothetical protein